MQRSPWFRVLIILGVLALGMYVVGQLWELAVHFGDIIGLFFLAWLLAFILLPVVRFLEARFPIGRSGAAAVVYVVLLVCLATLVVLIVPLFVDQVAQLAGQLPTLAASLPGRVSQVQHFLDERNLPIDAAALTGPSLSQQAGQLGSRLVENSVEIASGIANGVFRLTLVIILSFYIVLDGDRFLAQVLASVPERFAADARLFTVGIDRSFGGFLRGTAIQAGILGLGTAVIMSVAGLRYVLLSSIFAAVVMIVPFIGPFLALIVPVLIAVFSNLPTSQLLLIVLALVALQFLVMNVIAPAVMSESVGLHPLLVFLGLLVGIKQAGLAGAIFGVPLAAVVYDSVVILLRRWSVIGAQRVAVGEAVSPEDPTAFEQTAPAVSLAVPPRVPRLAKPRPIRLERLGPHLGSAIARIFHPRPS
jgi:predicted PurR-regulated permease PerM